MMLHVCKKWLFFDTNLKVALYLAAVFLVSLIADFLPIPRTYFARSNNSFNVYFVKIGWFWTLLLSVPFLALTAYTHCCGRRSKIIKGHVTRLIIATVFWYFFTSLFSYIENNYGRCLSLPAITDKRTCLKLNKFWNGFDLSGHCFILIYSSLILIEEARAIVGWDSIKDYLRDEIYARSIQDTSFRTNPLKNLTESELNILRDTHEKYTPYVRMLFIAITALQLLWDVMLVSTLLYFHIMIEKFISGAIAILLWFATYRVWYKLPNYFPNLPGDGIFKYNKDKAAAPGPLPKKRSSLYNGKHFMGNPLYGEPKETPVVDDPTR